MYIAFEVDDALGPPHGNGLFHEEDSQTTFYHYTRPRLPFGVGRPLLSASSGVRNGFLAYDQGKLQRVPRPPSRDFLPGCDRVAATLERLMQRPEIRDIAHEPVFTLSRD